MRESLNNLCKRFTWNINKSKKKYKFEHLLSNALAAVIYTKEDRDIDIDKIDKAKKVITDNTGIFSDFRGSNIFIGSVKLSLKDNMEEEFFSAQKTLEVFKKEFKFSRSSSTLAYFLAENRYKFDSEKAVLKGKEVYKIHKKNHPFITGDEDILLSILLGVNKEDINQGILDSEYYFGKLKGELKYSEDVQKISNIFSLFDMDKNEISNRLIRLYSVLKDEKYKFSRDTLFTLALVTLLEKDEDKIKNDIIEVYENLKENNIVGMFKMEKSYGLMFSAIIVTIDYIKNSEDNDKKQIKDTDFIIMNQINYIENMIEDLILMNTIILTNTVIASTSSS